MFFMLFYEFDQRAVEVVDVVHGVLCMLHELFLGSSHFIEFNDNFAFDLLS